MSLTTKIGTGIFLTSSLIMATKGIVGINELSNLRDDYPKTHPIITEYSDKILLNDVLPYYLIASIVGLGTMYRQTRETNQTV